MKEYKIYDGKLVLLDNFSGALEQLLMMIEEGMTADADSLESTKASISQIEMTFNQLDTQFTADITK